METYIMRVWLPDRPGALGDVATRVGAVDGEIVGIDILERGAGRAIDELAVQVPDAFRVDDLIAAVRSIDGADIEEIRAVDGSTHDPRADALETAAIMVGAAERGVLLDSLVTHGRRLLGGSWSAVLELHEGAVLAVDGDVPSSPWLAAFLAGSRSSPTGPDGVRGADDVVWAPLPGADLAVVAGRSGAPFRARERRQIAALARIADSRLVDFSRRAHPSQR